MAIDRNGSFFAGTYNGVLQSTDLGDGWTVLTDSIPAGVASLVIDSSNVIYAGAYSAQLYDGPFGGGLYRSIDHGKSWVKLPFVFGTAKPLAINSHGHLFTQSIPLVLRSTNGGSDWKLLSAPRPLAALAIGPNEHIYAAPFVDLYSSKDNGDTWTQMNLSETKILCIFIGPDNSIYCGTQNDGVLLRRPTDTSFTSLASGLTSQNISSLVMDQSGYLFAGSNDGGIFRSVNPVTGILRESEQHQFTFALAQNYPNPFNPSTTIHYQVPQSSFVSLAVYNILGQRLVQLVNEHQSPGHKQVNFHAIGLPSGVYIYRLHISGNIESKTMLLQK